MNNKAKQTKKVDEYRAMAANPISGVTPIEAYQCPCIYRETPHHPWQEGTRVVLQDTTVVLNKRGYRTDWVFLADLEGNEEHIGTFYCFPQYHAG